MSVTSTRGVAAARWTELAVRLVAVSLPYLWKPMHRDYALSFKPLPDTVEKMAELIRTDGFIRFPAALEPDHCDQLVANIFSLQPEKRSPPLPSPSPSPSPSRLSFLPRPLALAV